MNEEAGSHLNRHDTEAQVDDDDGDDFRIQHGLIRGTFIQHTHALQ